MDLGLSIDILDSFRIFQGRVTDNYMRLVEEYSLVKFDATAPITEQQRQVREVIIQSIDLEQFPSRIERVVHVDYGIAPPIFEEDWRDAEGQW
jgi:hypothetical protein